MTDLAALQSELEAAEAAVAEAESLQRRLGSLGKLEDATEAELVQAHVKLGDERRDVADLESFSPTRIWAALRGTRLDDLSREQAEVQAAEYAVAQLERRLKSLSDDGHLLRARLSELGDVRARRDQALAAKEAAVLAAGGEAGAELSQIAADLGATGRELKEVSEACDAAAAAARILQAADTMLGKASDWAEMDTWFGGGLLTDSIKYDRMDQASRMLRDADLALARLAEELGDLGRAGVPGPEVDGLTRTFDVWFDNIFSDWSVRRRIHDAQDRTRRAFHAVAEVRRSLYVRREELAGSAARMRSRREELLRG